VRTTETVLLRNCPFAFRCSASWSQLTPTTDGFRRHCGQCDRRVVLCQTDAQLRKALVQGECVAIPAELRHRPKESGDMSEWTVGQVSTSILDTVSQE
jgi:hypothetical protein